MIFKFKRNQLITLLDIFIISVVIFFVKNYVLDKKEHYTVLRKDNYEFIFMTDKEQYKKEELVKFMFTVKNKGKKDKALEFERSVEFNLIIENKSGIVFKRDLTDSLTYEPKKIIIKRYGEKSFIYEWDKSSNIDSKIIPGVYKGIAYSLDLDIELEVKFIID